MSRDHPQDSPQGKPPNKAGGVKRRDLLLSSTSLVAASALATALPQDAQAATPDVLPESEPSFKGKIGRTLKDSTPDFQRASRRPWGRPTFC